MGYIVMPFIAWFVAGSTKFFLNSIKAKELAFRQIGYGGLPSTHSSIVSSVAMLIALKEGADTPAFSVAIALAFIVILDAYSLRRAVGMHAQAINRLNGSAEFVSHLREGMGHTRLQIAAGVAVGVISALVVQAVGL